MSHIMRKKVLKYLPQKSAGLCKTAKIRSLPQCVQSSNVKLSKLVQLDAVI
jgi:hypothetical protein